MADLRIDPTTGDLDFSASDLQIIDGSEAIAQHLRIRLQFFLGEWFLNRDIGIPYFQDVFIKAPSTSVVRRIIRDVVAGTPGVAEVTDLLVDYEPADRRLNISFNATALPDGTPITFDEELVLT